MTSTKTTTTEVAALLLPVVHCYCFANAASVKHKEELRQSVVSRLATRMKCAEEVVERNMINMHNVRDVSPNKWMMCATFRVPPEVGFATTDVFAAAEDAERPAKRRRVEE